MKLREKMKRFCTLDVHNHAGFTLVELIIVIAILAILSTGAIAGYSAYVESAREAADVNLLSAYNTAINAACSVNGVPVDRMEGAEIELNADGTFKDIKMPDLSVARSSSNGLNDKVKADFLIYLGENTSIAFKFYVNIAFSNGSFVGYAEGEYTGKFGQILSGLGASIQGSINDFKESVFNEVGSDALLSQVTDVTKFSHDLAYGQNNLNYQTFLAQNALDMAIMMGYDLNDEAEAAEFMTLFNGMIADKAATNGITDPIKAEESARYEILSNYAVLSAAKGLEGKNASDLMADLRTGMTADELKAMMKSSDTEQSRDGLSKAAMLYGMYTAWANGLPESTAEEKAAKADALANAGNVNDFMSNGMNNSDFQDYLDDPNSNATKDLAGYLGAMDIINKSIEGDTNNEAITQLLMNGFSDATLGNAVEDVLK